MSDCTLVYGLGANKAGTTWLYRYLARHPQCYFRNVKELHYFDSLENNSFQRQVNRLNAQIERMSKKLLETVENAETARDAKKVAAISTHLADLKDWLALIKSDALTDEDYVRYLTDGCGNNRVVGDITPAYALVSEQTLLRMKNLTQRTKFIFLLRDPLDRLWSNLKMSLKIAGKTENEQLEALAEKVVSQRQVSAPVRMRSDYAGTFEKLRSVVEPERLFVAFYEDLFTQKTIDRLTDFLGIDRHPGNFGRVVHGGLKKSMPEGLGQAMAELLHPQYDYVEHYFGGAIPQKWKDNMEKVAA